MNAGSTLQLQQDEIPPFPVWRFTVELYHRLIAAGVFGEDDAVELLEGWIVPKMPRNPRHDATVDLADETLRGRVPAGWRVRGQSAVTTEDSEPEPDLAVVRGSARDYASRHPGPGDIALVVEVSDTSLARDRSFKGRIYARAGVPVYWVINLQDSVVEIYTDPADDGAGPAYRQRRVLGLEVSVPLEIDGATLGPVPVRDLIA